ncbi:MAG: carboxypeptidase-like regulatory domain-containing protein [Acidobacteriota bacterium]
MAPVYRWDQRLVAGETSSLAPVVLRTESTLAGWVRVREAQKIPPGLWVEALPQDFGHATEFGLQERLDRRRVRAKITDRGFFQLRGLAPGTYRLTAGGPNLASVSVSGIDVLPRAESLLSNPVDLEPPAQVVVVVSTPTDPRGLPLEILWSGPGIDGEWLRTSASVNDDGTWYGPPLAPGSHLMALRSPGWAQWSQEEVEVVSGEQQVFAEVPFFSVEGVVEWPPAEALEALSTATESPMQASELLDGASLWLTGTKRDRNRVRMEWRSPPSSSSESGTSFDGVLASEGTWYPRLYLPEIGQWVQFDTIQIERQAGEGAEELRLQVPTGSAEVEVVDAAGSPVPGAKVEIRVEDEDPHAVSLTQRTNEDGKVQLALLRPQSYLVEATALGHARAGEILEVGEGRYHLRLTLPEYRSIYGRLLDATGTPLLGARVFAWPRACRSGSCGPGQSVEKATTGEDGRFDLHMSTEVVAADFILLAPGQTLTRQRVQVGVSPEAPGSSLVNPLVLATEASGGTLLAPHSLFTLGGSIALDGVPLGAVILCQWAEAHGSVFSPEGYLPIPHLPPGAYRGCRRSPDFSRLLGCGEANLSIGGEAVLEIEVEEDGVGR